MVGRNTARAERNGVRPSSVERDGDEAKTGSDSERQVRPRLSDAGPASTREGGRERRDERASGREEGGNTVRNTSSETHQTEASPCLREVLK